MIAGIALSHRRRCRLRSRAKSRDSGRDESLLARAQIRRRDVSAVARGLRPKGERIAREGGPAREGDRGRITVVLPDGTVVADSAVGAAAFREWRTMRTTPEISDALSGTTGSPSAEASPSGRNNGTRLFDRNRGLDRQGGPVPSATLTRRLWQITDHLGTGLFALLLILAGAAFMARRVTGPWRRCRRRRRRWAGNLARRVQIRRGDGLEDMANAMNRMASHLADTIGQLDAGEARLETLLANLDDGVIVIAADRSVRMMNREAGKIFDASETMGAVRPYPEVIRHPQALAFIDGWIKGEEPKPRTFPS